MKITFLGTGSACPTRSRNVSSLALQLPEMATLWLFDCGEGTQHQILRSPLRLSQLDCMFFTHLHGDHLFGLPGLLASRSLQNAGHSPVTLFGPPGLEDFVRVALGVSHTHPGYPMRFQVLEPGVIYENSRFQVVCAPMHHRVESFGFAVLEKPLPGAFNVDLARSLNIPEGPVYGRLKSGETVTLQDGRTIDGGQLVGKDRPGRRFAYTGDTVFSNAAVALGLDADMLVHEATYLQADEMQARRGFHSTAQGAARTALEAGAHSLYLTHFSARYETGPQLTSLLQEAQAIFPNTILAYDFLSVEIPLREVASPTVERLETASVPT